MVAILNQMDLVLFVKLKIDKMRIKNICMQINRMIRMLNVMGIPS